MFVYNTVVATVYHPEGVVKGDQVKVSKKYFKERDNSKNPYANLTGQRGTSRTKCKVL